MKINNQKSKKTAILTLIILTILVCGTGAFFWWKNSQSSNNNQSPQSSSTDETKKASSEEKSKVSTEKSSVEVSKTENSNTDRTSGTLNNTTNTTTFPVTTSVQVEDGKVRIAGQISGLDYDDGTGKCTYELAHSSGAKIEIVTEILESPGNKYCKAVSKDINELESGSWTATTTYQNTNQKYEGKSDAQSFTIQK